MCKNIFVSIIAILIVLFPIIYMLSFWFLKGSNRNKIICPIDNCRKAFSDPSEYLEHLRIVHGIDRVINETEYENDIW